MRMVAIEGDSVVQFAMNPLLLTAANGQKWAFMNLNFTSFRLIGCVNYSAASLASAIASISIIASGV